MCKLTKFIRIGLAGASLGLLAGVGPGLAASADDDEVALARDLTVQQRPVFQLSSQVGVQGIGVDAWVDNPGLAYTVGQPLHIAVRPKRNAYITVVDVGSSGRVAVLYPNHFQRNARVRAGSTVMIPGPGAGWQINVSGPAGVDLIQVIASSRPLSLPELTQVVGSTADSPFLTLGRTAEEVARDLLPQLMLPQAGADAANAGVRNLLVRVVDDAAAIAPSSNQSGWIMPELLPAQPAAALGLDIRTDRPVYRVGDTVRVIASTERDCRLTLLQLGAGGRSTQLFPNALQRDNLLRAGEVVMIPAPRSAVQFVAHGPAGVENLMAICREEGMPDIYPLPPGSAAGDYFAVGTIHSAGRDLVPTVTWPTPAPATAQASTSYLVID